MNTHTCIYKYIYIERESKDTVILTQIDIYRERVNMNMIERESKHEYDMNTHIYA
jgi:hypothetical protein